MQKRVVKYEKLVLAPVTRRVADDDIGGVVVHIVEIVQNPQRCTHEAEVQRGRYFLIKNRNTDRLDVFPRLMERRDIEKGVLVDAVPAEENHRTWIFLRRLFELPDKIRVPRSLDQALQLVLIGGRQIAEPIDAFVDVGQRQQIQEDVEWRKDPGRKAV